MTTTTSPPVNFWQVRAAARANAVTAKSDSSSSTVPSSSASTSTATSVSTPPVSLPLIDDTDPFVVKIQPRNRPLPSLDDIETWPQVGKRSTQNDSKKAANDSPRKSEKAKSKWVPIPAQELQTAADTARAQRSRQPSNTSSRSTSVSQSQSQSRSRSRPQSQAPIPNGLSKERTTKESNRPNRSRSGSVVGQRDSSAATAQVVQSNELASVPSTQHSHPHQHHLPHPTPPRFSAMTHPQHVHQPPPQTSAVYPPYLHTAQYMDPNPSAVNGMNLNGANVNSIGYYPYHTPSHHPPAVPPPPSLSHSHSHSSSISIPYSYSVYDYSSGMYPSPSRSIPGSGVNSGLNSGYHTPFYGPGHAALGKLMFGSIEGAIDISRGVNERGSTSYKGWAIGEGSGKRKKRRKGKENKTKKVLEKPLEQTSKSKAKGKETEIIDLTEGKGVGMSKIVKKGVDSVIKEEKKDAQTRKWIFGSTDSSSDALAGDSETNRRGHRAQPSHLQTHLQQLPPLTVPVLSPIPPLPSILPTPLSSVPMPIQPLQSISSYPPPQHYYYDNASLDDMSWSRHQQTQIPQYAPSGIYGVPQIPRVNNERLPSHSENEGVVSTKEAEPTVSKEDTPTKGNEDMSEPMSSLSTGDQDSVSVPLSSTTATSSNDFEVRDYGYGLGHATGNNGSAAQDVREGTAVREQERHDRIKEREKFHRERERAGEGSPGQHSPKYQSRNLPDGPLFPLRARRGRGRGFRGDRGGRGWYSGRGGYNQQNSSGRGQYGSGPYSPHTPHSPHGSHSPGGLYTPYAQWQGQSGQYGQYGQYAQPPDPTFTLTPPPAFHPLPLPGENEMSTPGGMYYNPSYYNPQGPPPPPHPSQAPVSSQPHSPSSSPQAVQNGASGQEGESPDGQPGRDSSHSQAPVPTPITLLSFPLDPTRYYLLGQVEYYLSPQNMAQDYYLRKKMDSCGWVPISLIASFNRVRKLTTDERLLREVIALSSVVEVQGDSIRMRGDWERYVLPEAPFSKVNSRENLSVSDPNLYYHQYGPPDMGPPGMGQGPGTMGFEGNWYEGYPYWDHRHQDQHQYQYPVGEQYRAVNVAGEGTDAPSIPVPVEDVKAPQANSGEESGEDIVEGNQELEEEDEEEEDVVFVLGDSKETNMSGMWSPDRRS